MAGFFSRVRSWFFFINRQTLKRPVFWLAFLGLIFILVLILAIPYYITSRSQYCSTCHEMESYYKTWEHSTHANSDCLQCHVEPGFVNSLYHYLRTTRELYTNLLGSKVRATYYKKASNALCFACHTEYRDISASGDLLIPHKAHVKMRRLSCVDCHKYLVHFKNPEGKNTPSMTTCYKCHNGVMATKECRACHTKKAYPDSHRAAGFLEKHGQMAQTIGKECAKCHGWTPRYCEECHQKRPPSHGPSGTAGMAWRTLHRDSASIREKGCLVCHGQNFCKNCHD